MRLTAKIMGNRFTTALNTKLSSARLAETVVDELFLSYQLQSEVELCSPTSRGQQPGIDYLHRYRRKDGSTRQADLP